MGLKESRMSTLGEVCEGDLQTGPFGSQLHAHEYEERGIAVVMPKDIVDGRVDLSGAAKVSDKTAHRLEKHRLKAGDIIFSRRGDVARTALISEETEGSLCGTGCLRARPSVAHSPQFISYQLQLRSMREWLERNAVGQTMPNLNTAILARLPIQVSGSRRDEDAVVELLNAWDRAIAITKRLIATNEKQKLALFQQLLSPSRNSFKKLKLKDMAVVNQRSLDSSTPSDYSFRYISLSDVEDGRIAPQLEEHVVSSAPSRAQRKVASGDILMSTVRPNLLGFARVGDSDADCIASTGFAVLSTKPQFDRDYLYHYLYSQHIIGQLNALVVGSNYPAINPGDVENLMVFCPASELQKKIGQILNNCDAGRDGLHRQRGLLMAEKDALMQRLLTGKRLVKLNNEAAPVAVNG